MAEERTSSIPVGEGTLQVKKPKKAPCSTCMKMRGYARRVFMMPKRAKK